MKHILFFFAFIPALAFGQIRPDLQPKKSAEGTDAIYTAEDGLLKKVLFDSARLYFIPDYKTLDAALPGAIPDSLRGAFVLDGEGVLYYVTQEKVAINLSSNVSSSLDSSGTVFSLSIGAETYFLDVADNDNSVSNEIQALSIDSTNTTGPGRTFLISIQDGNTIAFFDSVGVDTDDQTAAQVSVTPTGNLNSTTVQAALEEHQDDIDSLAAIAPDGVATAGAYNASTENIDITVASPGSNFSIDVSALLDAPAVNTTFNYIPYWDGDSWETSINKNHVKTTATEVSNQYQVRLGVNAGSDSLTADFQNAFGLQAGQNNTGSYQNAFGREAGRDNTGNFQNAFGFYAGLNNTGTDQNAFGLQAGQNNTGGYQNAFGREAGLNNTGGYQNAFGFYAGENNTGGYQNAFGREAGRDNTGTDQNAFGFYAGENNTGGYQNAFGLQAGRYNTAPYQNAFGREAGRANTGNFQNAFGFYAGLANTGTSQNAFGLQAGQNNTGGYQNAFGREAGLANTGTDQNAFGQGAGRDNTGTDQNAFGREAGQYNQGDHNISIGYQSGRSVLQSVDSLGAAAGDYNTWLNYRAGYNIKRGDDNIGIGYDALFDLTDGDNNIAFGRDAGNTLTTQNNTISLGRSAIPSQSGDITIGNTTYYDRTLIKQSTYLQEIATNDSDSLLVIQGDGLVGYRTRLTATDTLDFSSTSAQNSADLTITVTGAAVGDPVSLGLPASINANTCYTAWVSAANTVTVRFNNYSAATVDPASGSFKVIVHK